MRRSLFLALGLLLLASIGTAQRASSLIAQPAASHTATHNDDERAGIILVRVAPAAVPELASAFGTVRPFVDPAFSHTDIHSARLTDDAVITRVLALPTGALHKLRLHPYIPTHSIAFEDIRERSNPALFASGARAAITSTELGVAEENLSRWFVLEFDSSVTPETAAKLVRRSALIELAEPRYIRHPLFTPNDSLLPQQYGLTLMHTLEAWDVVRCDSTLVVADVDNGTDWSHEDLAAAIYTNQGEVGIDSNGLDKRSNGVDDDGNGFIDDWHGWDFDGATGSAPDNDSRSNDVHGTHTAGLLGACGNNVKGIAGVAFGAKLIPIKVSPDDGQNLDFGFEGMIYAADMHAKVVNCSWGGSTFAAAEQDAVDYVVAKDCSPVVAAGNNGAYEDFYPGAYHHVLCVAAVGADGTITGYSNYNTHVGVAAPGGASRDVISLYLNNQYGPDNGTSMASPQACGVVALVRKRFPSFTSEQAIQQVRATSDPMTLDSTDNRKGLIGHGLVNALKAVTVQNAHAARIESVRLADDLGHGAFAPGETGSIVLSVKNYLSPVQHLIGHVEVFQGSNAIDLLSPSDVPFGAASTLASVANDSATFRIHVHDSIDPNTTVIFRVTFSDASVGYQSDIDYFDFIIAPAFLDLDRTNVRLTVSGKGTLGYNDITVNSEGSGMVWQHPPTSIEGFGTSVLYQVGLMVGTDSDHVADVVQDASGFSEDQDLAPWSDAHYATDKAHPNATQAIACAYSDSAAQTAVKVGVNVEQGAYAFPTGLAANAVVLDYKIHRTASLAPPATDTMAIALFSDWDIGLSGAVNVTRFDSSTMTAITRRLEPGYPYVGVKIISPIPDGAAVQYHAIQNNGGMGDINTYTSFTKPAKWISMNEWFEQTGPADVSHTIGLRNLPLPVGDSAEMTVVIALGTDEASLRQAIDLATVFWASPNAVGRTLTGSSDVTAYPDPFTTTLHVGWAATDLGLSEAHARLIDVLGRTVISQDATGTSAIDIPTAALQPGLYTLELTSGAQRTLRKVVCTR